MNVLFLLFKIRINCEKEIKKERNPSSVGLSLLLSLQLSLNTYARALKVGNSNSKGAPLNFDLDINERYLRSFQTLFYGI